ncbi:cytochrome P450 [Bacillus aquiflavi]|uniref:Cytochrome P450 n=1 Tax=Bacillus aquiflavi TaxID=2672567 RepID=A0A6B3W3R3_9BACI|nr:cytochrome P450 [Bacillus aquiflavi]MBA4538171.1 cytochrome P450 [Bacillus aquiflavi]NEY82491.1 cytochrome P450 [Bacillus aquiflavi]UAC48100.1 cytochrome P450 [Bacillus aquiflavi]
MAQQAAKQISISSPEFIRNPYPYYDELRSINPIYKMDSFKYPGWYITGYEEVVTVLKNNAFKNRIPLPETTRKYQSLKNIQNNMMLFKNKQDHKRLRMLISKGFTLTRMNKYRSYIKEVVHELLHEAENNKTIDVVTEFAFPLASLVIAKILGIPEEDRKQFRKWALTLVPTIDFSRTRKTLENGNITVMRLVSYFTELIKKRKHSPEEDLISMLLQDKQQDDNELSDEELLATCILLVIAGHETTVNLISNAVLSFITHPEQLKKLTQNPALIELAIEEILRYESPTQMTARTAAEEVELNGNMIKKGDQVYLMLGAANRDPRIFTEPHKLDITRNPNPHLAFGYGAHFCIGSTLARLEAQIAMQTLLKRFNNFAIATNDLQWRNLVGFRSLGTLKVTFSID